MNKSIYSGIFLSPEAKLSTNLCLGKRQNTYLQVCTLYRPKSPQTPHVVKEDTHIYQLLEVLVHPLPVFK